MKPYGKPRAQASKAAHRHGDHENKGAHPKKPLARRLKKLARRAGKRQQGDHMNKTWVVRVITDTSSQRMLDLVENLRYCGMAVVHPSDRMGVFIFDLVVRDGSKEGAERVAQRMCTFGFNAAAALLHGVDAYNDAMGYSTEEES